MAVFYCAGSKARCSKSCLGLFSEGYVSDWYLDNGVLLENIINMNNMNLMGKLFVVTWWSWQKVPVENSNKNHKNIVQKCVDVSTFSRYYRDSFWIQNLFTEAKHKNSQNNSTLYKDRFSSQLPVFFDDCHICPRHNKRMWLHIKVSEIRLKAYY